MQIKTEKEVALMSFEQAMDELEKIISELERGEIALEDSITAYEYGTLLRRKAESKLKDAKERIDKITVAEDSTLSLEEVSELKERHGGKE